MACAILEMDMLFSQALLKQYGWWDAGLVCVG